MREFGRGELAVRPYIRGILLQIYTTDQLRGKMDKAKVDETVREFASALPEPRNGSFS